MSSKNELEVHVEAGACLAEAALLWDLDLGALSMPESYKSSSMLSATDGSSGFTVISMKLFIHHNHNLCAHTRHTTCFMK